ncbi:MAG: hypothetical protein WD403_08715 [Pirellulales bacterium]
MPSSRASKIPLWVKVVYTAFLCVLVPYYWKTYGPANFLWFCDVALLVALAALWLESSLLASMQAVAIVVPQMLWVLDFGLQLFMGRKFFGLAEYMFDSSIPLFVRGLSSFHGWLPFLLVWLVWRLGYDRRAWIVQTVAAWLLLPASFLLTDPPPPPPENPAAAVNVNWVYGPGKTAVQTWMAPELFVGVLMIGFPIIIYFPSHLAFSALFGKRDESVVPVMPRSSEVE